MLYILERRDFGAAWHPLRIKLGKMRKINLVPAIALIYIGIIGGIGWGFAIGKYEVFPFPLLKDQYQEIVDFVGGDVTDNTTALEKLRNDFGRTPFRYMKERVLPNEQDFELHDVDAQPGLFASERRSPRFFSKLDHGYYLMYGVFEFEASRYGALLIDHQGKIVRTWTLDLLTEDPDIVKGGFDPRSGTIISNMSKQLEAKDYCGKPMWKKMDLNSHHSIEPDDEGGFWHSDSLFFEKRDVSSGEVTQRFSVIDIMEANPDLHILEPRLKHKWTYDKLRNLGTIDDVDLPRIQAMETPFHFNDVSPLTAELEPYFPQFRKDDLLVSANVLNLVMVVRPENQKILWYRSGLTGQQHDPDFQPNGEISVYDNNSHGKHSRIVALDVEEHKLRVLLDGEAMNLHSVWLGNHTVLDDQSIVVVATTGRVFHVDKDGEVLFYFENTFNDTQNLEIRNVWHLSDDLVERLEATCK